MKSNEWDVRQSVGLITAIKLMRSTCTTITAIPDRSDRCVCRCARRHSEAIETEAEHKARDTLLQLIVGVSEHLVP